MEHTHIALLTCQRHEFVWVFFVFCRVSQEAIGEDSVGGHPHSKNVCCSERTSLFSYSSPLKLVHK